MSSTAALLATLPVDAIRHMLPPWIADHVAEPELGAAARAAVEAALDRWDDDAIDRLRQALLVAGDEWRFYPADPVARSISRAFIPLLAAPASVAGLDHLDRFLAEGPRRKLIVCNHLSYTDTQATDAILAGFDRAGAADRLVAVAGPKVYTEAWRRMAAVALNTRKVVQSSQVASEQEALPVREVGRLALEAIEDLELRLDDGLIVLLYAEGTRSRDGAFQPFLKAVQRYLSLPDLAILPLAQTGTERLFPRDEAKMYRAPVSLRFGESFVAADFSGKGAALREAWGRLAAILPEGYRPHPGTEPLI